MTPLSTVDLAALLAPISATNPAGPELRYDPLYDRIRELRKEEDPSLPQGVWQRELQRADWPAVASLCSEVLAGRSKDLQVAVWLLEAWIHLHGFPGLEWGLRLLAGLCRDFWDDLHPPREEGSAEARLALIDWVAERLLLAVKQVPVTAPLSEEGVPYTWLDWEAGLYLENLIRLDAKAAANAQARGLVTQAQFLASCSLTPTPWWQDLFGQLGRALEAVATLTAELGARCGDRAPSLGSHSQLLVAIQAFAARVLEERGEPEEVGGGLGVKDPEWLESDGLPEGRSGGITSRAEAFQRLKEAADFLAHREPHSPVPYLVWRAISWGSLSLADLLSELLRKNTDLAALEALLGIKRND
jgi:type VI secretion system protein ImpA